MATSVNAVQLNGLDLLALRRRQEQAQRDSTSAARHPKLTAHWVGGTRARIDMGGQITYLGGEGEPNAMQALLAALAA
jgi:hypothetical protein